MSSRTLRFFQSLTALKVLGLLSFLGFAVYANSLDNSFHFDDLSSLRNVRSVQEFNDLGRLFRQRSENVVAYASFALNYQISGSWVFSYHFLNTVIHVLAAWMVFLLARHIRRQKDGALPGDALVAAAWAGLFFLLHPLQTQAVTYVVQRIASLAALFYLVSVYAYLKGRDDGRLRWFVLSSAAALAAFFTKQNAYSLPFVLLAAELLWKKPGTSVRQIAVRLLPFAAALVLVYFCLYHRQVVEQGLGAATRERAGLDRTAYFLTQLEVLPYYLKLVILPVGQSLYYDWPLAKSLLEPRVLAGAVFLLTFLGAGFYAARRGHKTIAFGIFWFFITQSIESSFIPLPDPVFEHRMYLPMVGLAFLFGSAALPLMHRRGGTILLIGAMVLCAGLTIRRNQVWDNGISLNEDAYRRFPDYPRALANLGVAYSDAGETQKSAAMFDRMEKALETYHDPLLRDHYRTLMLKGKYNLAFAEKDYDQALHYAQELRSFNEVGFDTLPLCFAYFYRKEYDRARACAIEHDEVLPGQPSLNYMIGSAYLQEEKLDEARHYFSLTLEQALGQRERLAMDTYQTAMIYGVSFNLGLLLIHQNKPEEALPFLELASREAPLKGEPYYLKALCYFLQNRIPDAMNEINVLKQLGREDLLALLRSKIKVTSRPDQSADQETRERYLRLLSNIEQAKRAAQVARNLRSLPAANPLEKPMMDFIEQQTREAAEKPLLVMPQSTER